MKTITCWDSPCVYGKPVCCLECYSFENCPERCDQLECRKEMIEEAEREKFRKLLP